MRPETTVVGRYGDAMLRELAANKHKGGWRGRSNRDHFSDLDYHVSKLKAAVRSGDQRRILEFAADVGNHAMFIADDRGALELGVIRGRTTETDYVAPPRRFWLRMLRYPRSIPKAIGGLRSDPREPGY